jgi:dTDP-4-dehydrorhamnose reductase
MKKILVLGANGQLGAELCEQLGYMNYPITAITHQDAGIEDTDLMRQIIEINAPDIVINTTAFHQVDLCESNPEKAFLINAESPAKIAEICKARGIEFIHFSTDYVFDGAKREPYLETDLPNPLNLYGKSKLAGEQNILSIDPTFKILRVSGLYGKYPCRAKNGLNFVELMLKKGLAKETLNVVDNEWVSPTYTLSIAQQMPAIFTMEEGGIIHCSSEGMCSWHEFAKSIFEIKGMNTQVNACDLSAFPAKTPRPAYSVMENEKLKNAGKNIMPHWKDALKIYLS